MNVSAYKEALLRKRAELEESRSTFHRQGYDDPRGRFSNGPDIGSVSLVPVAIGIAVLRYRLYEIDRLISRTIAWALVTRRPHSGQVTLASGAAGSPLRS